MRIVTPEIINISIKPVVLVGCHGKISRQQKIHRIFHTVPDSRLCHGHHSRIIPQIAIIIVIIHRSRTLREIIMGWRPHRRILSSPLIIKSICLKRSRVGFRNTGMSSSKVSVQQLYCLRSDSVGHIFRLICHPDMPAPQHHPSRVIDRNYRIPFLIGFTIRRLHLESHIAVKQFHLSNQTRRTLP